MLNYIFIALFIFVVASFIYGFRLVYLSIKELLRVVNEDEKHYQEMTDNDLYP